MEYSFAYGDAQGGALASASGGLTMRRCFTRLCPACRSIGGLISKCGRWRHTQAIRQSPGSKMASAVRMGQAVMQALSDELPPPDVSGSPVMLLGEVDQPQGVGPVGGEVPLHQVRRPRRGSVGVCGAKDLAAPGARQSG